MTSIPLKEITSARLNDFLRHLNENDDVILTKKGDGFRVRVRRAGSSEMNDVKNSFIRSVGFAHTKSSWVVSAGGAALPAWRDFGHDKKLIKGAAKEKTSSRLKHRLMEELGMRSFIGEPITTETLTVAHLGKVERVKLDTHYLYFRDKKPIGCCAIENGTLELFKS